MNQFKRKKDSHPVIGKAITWNYSIERVFKVLEFNRAGTIIKPDGKVKAKSIFKPYGYLLVEDPNYQEPILLPITHRDDFLLAASVYDDPQIEKMLAFQELLVTYLPKGDYPKGFAGVKHALHFVITNPSSFIQYYRAINSGPSDSLLEELFVELKWDGELRVQIN